MIDRIKAACARAWARVRAAWRRTVGFLLALLVGVGVVSYAETRDIALTHPTQRTDGTALSIEEIQETRLYCDGSLHSSYPPSVTNLQPEFGFGPHSCYATTVDTFNQESDPSGTLDFVVTPARPEPPVIALQ